MKQRIGLIGENSIEYVRRLINIWNEGNCAVIIDWRIPLTKSIQMLIDAGVRMCYIDASLLDDDLTYNDCGIEFNTILANKSSYEKLPEDIHIAFDDNYSRDEALILYSSGTTGKAKGVILSHYAIQKNAEAICEYMSLNCDDSIYIAKPLSHSSTIVGELLVGLKLKIAIYLGRSIVSPSVLLKNLENSKSTIVCVNPTLLKLMTMSLQKRDKCLRSIRTIYTSGAIIEPKLLYEAKNVFGGVEILNVYGLTEMGPRVTAQRHSDTPDGSVGKPILNVKVKIKKRKKYDGSKKIGEVWVHTPYIMNGYVENNVSSNNHWFNTGDLGYFDNNGNLYITGRSDNAVLVGSHIVYLEDVEKSILQVDGVQDCVVLSKSHEVHGNILVCYYEGYSEEFSSENIRNHCIRSMASYEVPYEFIKMKKLLTNLNGKKIRDINEYEKVQ